MARSFSICFTSWLCLLIATLTTAQDQSNCQNTLYKYNFQQRTACTNDSKHDIRPIETLALRLFVF